MRNAAVSGQEACVHPLVACCDSPEPEFELPKEPLDNIPVLVSGLIKSRGSASRRFLLITFINWYVAVV